MNVRGTDISEESKDFVKDIEIQLLIWIKKICLTKIIHLMLYLASLYRTLGAV